MSQRTPVGQYGKIARNIMLSSAMFLVGLSLHAQVIVPQDSSDISQSKQVSDSLNAVPVIVSFRTLESDSELSALLRRFHAKPYAIYMSGAGLFGHHSVPPSEASEAVIPEARQITGAMQLNALEGSAARARRLLSSTPSEEMFFSSLETQERARKLLWRESQQKELLAISKAQVPMIYAMEIFIEPHLLPSLSSHLSVARVDTLDMAHGQILAPKPLRPEPTYKSLSLPEPSLSKLFTELHELARR